MVFNLLFRWLLVLVDKNEAFIKKKLYTSKLYIKLGTGVFRVSGKFI